MIHVGVYFQPALKRLFGSLECLLRTIGSPTSYLLTIEAASARPEPTEVGHAHGLKSSSKRGSVHLVFLKQAIHFVSSKQERLSIPRMTAPPVLHSRCPTRNSSCYRRRARFPQLQGCPPPPLNCSKITIPRSLIGRVGADAAMERVRFPPPPPPPQASSRDRLEPTLRSKGAERSVRRGTARQEKKAVSAYLSIKVVCF